MKKAKNLSSEERISRIEQAPVEMQVMIAKAYIRDDIDDNDVQYTFNTDTINQLNEDGAATVENVDAEMPEGIGAGEFFIRNYRPEVGNKNYITTGAGGWNTCIKGFPQDPYCNVLANCVGYASGRFNEIINLIRGTIGCTYRTLNCNAENFIERAVIAGLRVGDTPKVGAIGCAMQGTLASSDGAGHVWIVEKVNADGSIYTSESGYGSSAFWNQTRSNANGRWGLGTNYTFRGFIYLPDDVQAIVDEAIKPEPTPEPTPTPTPSPSGQFNIGDRVRISGPLYTSANALAPVGTVGEKITTVTRKAVGALHPYNTDGDLGWMDESSLTRYEEPAPQPEPTPVGLQVGDRVRIIGTGNGSSYGGSATAYGIGWERQILEEYPGRPFPYRVGNASGTTGFYAENALQKI